MKTQAQLLKAHAIFGEPQGEPRIYRIIRFRAATGPRTVKSYVTLSEAQAHCKRRDTHGDKGGAWFDGYDYVKGCEPKEDR